METNDISEFTEKKGRNYHLWIIGLFIAIYLVAMGLLVTFIHTRYLSTHDLGIFVQSFWTTTHNLGFFTNTVDAVYLCSFGAHDSPILFVLLPLYAIVQNPLLFPLVSTVLLAIAAVPLFYIARTLFPDRFSYIIVAVYLLSPAIHGINLYNFSTIAFVPLFFFTCWYGMITRNWRLYLAAGFLLILVREDVSLLAAMIGVYGLFLSGEKSGRMRVCHILLVISAVIFTLLSMMVIIPHFSPADTLSTQYSGHLLENLNQFTDLRAGLFAKTFGPVLLIPFAAPEVLVVGIFQFLEVFLSPQAPFLDMQFHYPGMFQPVVILATLYGMKRIYIRIPPDKKEKIGRLLEYLLLAGSIIGLIVVSPIIAYLSIMPEYLDQAHTEKFRVLDSVINQIPGDAIVVTQDNIIPHLSERKKVYLYGYHPEADYVVIETGTGYANIFGNDIKQYQNWKVLVKKDEIIVLSNPRISNPGVRSV